ncbi:MAG: DUF4416 family protein [Deltaproteobacteria bacterium]|nr:DUF4416 family protein [Deltaproteobacteria bacterium]MCK5710392.1 DUF4416 family protein [Deltaproteobacteria bacterium]
MSRLQEPSTVRLFMGLIYKPDSSILDLIEMLEEKLGAINFESTGTPFNHSSYYTKEMGGGLLRKILTFQKLIRRTEIVEIKIFTNNLEKVFSYEGDRTINIDPGYIAQEHLILATAKGYSHRPYLGSGVYADLTLVYMNNEYKTLQWTYPDYGREEMRVLFKDLRNKYVSQLKKEQNI